MKKLFILLIGALMFLPISLSSCSGDDDNDNEIIGSTTDLIGVWESVSGSAQIKKDGKVIANQTLNNNSSRIEFYEDGTYRFGEYYDGEWDWDYEAYEWKYVNGKIILKDEQDDYEYYENYVVVKSLTSKKLIVNVIEKYIEDGSSYEMNSTVEFRKISN